VRSLFAKITIWSLITLVLAMVGVQKINGIVSRRDRNFLRLQMQLDDARLAYETGGPERLGQYLQRLANYFPGEHYLTDPSGRDLLDDTDRSSLLRQANRQLDTGRAFTFSNQTNMVSMFFRSADYPFIMRHISGDKRYNFIVVVKGPRPFTDSLPYYLLILAVVVVFGYLLAVNMASPLRQLEKAVERFGAGDLTARVNSRRMDEFGDLARRFDQMAQRIEMLMTAERRLLQDISHELRSPLARLSFGVELARTAEDREAAVARIRKEVDRLSSLVGGLLQVTRAEADLSQRDMEAVDLRALLVELTGDCDIEAEKRGCEVVLDAPKAVILRGDRELLRRAIENVLRNAIRYAPEGTVIEVKLDPNPDVAAISIRDYGTGVPDELLTEIFKPFFRVGQARDTASGGVGLGLAIAQRAVALHQGKMAARNMDPGLLVSVELPLHTATA
jgi:signal transduction histidine kinase